MNEKEFKFKVYEEHARTLKAWLIAYGVGLPALLISNTSAWNAVKAAQQAPRIGWLFAVGIGLQLFLLFLTKYCMWWDYYKLEDPKCANKWLCKCSCTIGNWIWIDIVCDAATIGLFSWGTFIVLSTFIK